MRMIGHPFNILHFAIDRHIQISVTMNFLNGGKRFPSEVGMRKLNKRKPNKTPDYTSFVMVIHNNKLILIGIQLPPQHVIVFLITLVFGLLCIES